MPYATPNMTSHIDMFTYANDVTGGLFWSMILGAIFVVAFGTLQRTNGTSKAFAASTFFTGLIASIMFVLTLIDSLVLGIALAGAIAGLLMLWFKN